MDAQLYVCASLKAARACCNIDLKTHLYVGALEDEHAAGEGHEEAQAPLNAQEVGGPHLAARLVRADAHVDDLVPPHDVPAAQQDPRDSTWW
jgi:hypothetical protein